MQLEKCALQMDMKRTWNGESATAKRTWNGESATAEFAAALFVEALKSVC